MNKYIYDENYKFINDWINNNPNFKSIIFDNNILIDSLGIKINLENYLVSNLLKSEYFKNNIYKMDENTFFKAVRLNLKAFKIFNGNIENITNDEKINNVRIDQKGKAVAETENSKVEITDHTALKVLSTYTSLIANDTIHIPLSTLLKSLNNNKFYELINSSLDLSKEDYDYINEYSNYMLELLQNEELLTDETKKLLYDYQFSMNSLTNINRNSNQNVALNIYIDNLRLYNKEESIKQKDEETLNLKVSSSLGYSSLVLIVTSVIVTVILIMLLIIIN